MAKTFSELQALALQIRDEILEKKNTAPRVGAALLDMIDNTIQNITDINQKLSVFEHVCSGFKRVQSESQLPVTPPEDEKTVGYLVGKNLYLYVGKDGNAVNGRYFNVGDITGPKGEIGPQGIKGDKGDKGEQGNSGVSGSTDNIEVVNNLEGGESTPDRIKVLAAEQGKVLKEKFSELDKQYLFKKTEYNKNDALVKAGYFASIIDASFMLDTYDANKEYGLYLANIKNKPYNIALYELSPLKSVMGFNCNDDGPILLFKEKNGGKSYVKIDLSKLDLEANFSINAAQGINLNPGLFNNPNYSELNKISSDLEKSKSDIDNLGRKYEYLNGSVLVGSSAADISQVTESGYKQTINGPTLSNSFWVNGIIPIPQNAYNIVFKNLPSANYSGQVLNYFVDSNDRGIEGTWFPGSDILGVEEKIISVPEGAAGLLINASAADIKTYDIKINSKPLLETFHNIEKDVLELKDDVIYSTEDLMTEPSISNMEGYAYTNQKTIFVNQYTSSYRLHLYILEPGKYKFKQVRSIEKPAVIVGVLSSEEDFMVGGVFQDIIMGGNGLDASPLQSIYLDLQEETFIAVLGNITSPNYYSETYRIIETKIKDEIKEVKDEIEDITSLVQPNNLSIVCPNKFYAAVGQEFNLYYDSLIKGIDAGLRSPFGIYVDIQCPDLQNASNQIGVRRERMWQIEGSKLTSDYLGEHNLQITAFDNNGKQLSQKVTKIVVTNSSPLSSKKYILCIGDSLTNNGPIVATMGQHFQDLGGTQPIFVGQRTSSGYKHEGYPGYSFGSFVTNASNYAYRIFDVPTGTNVSINDKYSTNGSQYTIKDIRTEGLDNKLRLRCERSSGSTEPNPTGTLTKISGSSSSAESIEYSAFEKESGNPFWDLETGQVNFTKYREKMGMSSNKFDLIIIMLGTNDCIGNIKDMNNSLLNAKKLIETIFEDAGDYPTKVILQMTPPDANTISSWQVYSDSDGTIGRKMGYWTNLWNLRKLLYDEFTKSEWENKVYLGQAALGLDRYYGFPNTKIKSSNRINIEEIYHTNSVHPNNEGYQQLGDGYYLQAKGILVE